MPLEPGGYKMKLSAPKHVADELLKVNKKTLEINYFRASGKGGQHRNKTDTACRIKHKPTGIIAESTDSRSQADNRYSAFRKLIARLADHYDNTHKERLTAAGWSEKIRTYHEPRGTVKDHRTGVTAPYRDTLDGKLEPFIEAAIND